MPPAGGRFTCAGIRRSFSQHHVIISCVISVVLFAIVCSIELDPDNVKVSRAAAVAVFMASMWVLTPVPVAVTALVPLVMFPLMGIMNGRDVARQYFSDTHFIFIGSFFLADGLQRVNLHRRISIKLLSVLGLKPFWLLFGFCISTFLLSTCLSNTATTIMLMPLTVSVVDWMEAQAKKTTTRAHVTGASFGAAAGSGEEEEEGREREREPVAAVAGQHKVKSLGGLRSSRRRNGGEEVELAMLEGGEEEEEEEEEEGGGGHLKLGHCVSMQFASGSDDSASERGPSVPSRFSEMRKALALGVAYSANIGGVVTLTGTMPNLVYQGQLPLLFENAPAVTFAQWFAFAAPYGCVMFVISFLILSFKFCPPTCSPSPSSASSNRTIDAEHCSVLVRENEALGKLRFAEIVVMCHGGVLVLLWFTRTSIGGGWSQLLPEPGYVTDGTAAILVSLSMFLWPAKPWWKREEERGGGGGGGGGGEREEGRAGTEGEREREREKEKADKGGSDRLLDSTAIFKLPWDCVLLLGGGFALAEGSKESGLAAFLAACLGSFSSVRPLLLLFAIVLMTSFVTEFNSNLAATSMLLPVVAQLSLALKVHPLAHMIPTTIACSFAFMLPVATPPNAIAFATNAISTRDMISTGVWLNLMACLLIALYTSFAFEMVYGEDPFVCPAWACPD